MVATACGPHARGVIPSARRVPAVPSRASAGPSSPVPAAGKTASQDGAADRWLDLELRALPEECELLSVGETVLFGTRSGVKKLGRSGLEEVPALSRHFQAHARPPNHLLGGPFISWIAGDWPSDAWVSINYQMSRRLESYGPLEHFRAGKLVRSVPTRKLFLRGYRWTDQQLLGLTEDGWEAIPSLGPAPLEQQLADCPHPLLGVTRRRPRLLPFDAEVSSSGEVFLLGADCLTPGQPVVERWETGARTSRWDVLPHQPDLPDMPGGESISASSARDVFVALPRWEGSPADGQAVAYLVHFDGSTWTEVETPFHTPIAGLAATERGDVWIAVEPRNNLGSPDLETLWIRTVHGRWWHVRISVDTRGFWGEILGWEGPARRLWVGSPIARTLRPVDLEALDRL